MATQVDEFAKGVSSFASDFYQLIVQQGSDNVIVSPYSVANALVLLSQAAGGKSYEEIKNVLHLSGEKSAIPDQFFGYYNSLKESAGNATFSVANEIFVQKGNNLNKNFQELAEQKLLSAVESVDFSKSAEAAQTINQFVEKKTNDKIKNLFSSNDISGASVVLVNAIYMKAKWKIQFAPYKTHEKDFYLNDDDKVSVDFMHATKPFNYGVLSDLDATALELKYLDSDFAMLFVLPNSKTGLSGLQAKLKDYDLSKIGDQLNNKLVKVALPKFKVEYKANLKDILIKLGMTEIFGGKADLSGLLENGESLSVSDAIHKAYIEINEKGTEAAAATGLIMLGASLEIFPEDTPKFYADHPFVYYIWDSKAKTVLFSGHILTFASE